MQRISDIIDLLHKMEFLNVDREEASSSYFEWDCYFSFAYNNRNSTLDNEELILKLQKNCNKYNKVASLKSLVFE